MRTAHRARWPCLLLWLIFSVLGAAPELAPAPSATESGSTPVPAPAETEELLKLKAELQNKEKELSDTKHANEELKKEKLLEDHKLKEQLVQSKLDEQIAAKALRAQLQEKLMETEEKLMSSQVKIKGEVRDLKHETSELIRAHVLNQTDPTVAGLEQLEPSEEDDENAGINQLGKFVKDSEHQKHEHQKAKTTLNQTLRETQGELATVVKVVGNPKTQGSDHSSSAPRLNATGSQPASKLIDADHNEYVLVKSGTNPAATDKTLLKDLVVVLVAASGSALIAQMVGIPTLLGYIVAGSLVGPSVLSFVESFVQVETLAQLGVTFLLYALGLEMSIDKLRAVWKIALVGGGLSMFVQVVIVMSLALSNSISMSQGLFVGCFVSMSSTAVVLKCLKSSGKLGTASGDAMVGILIFQDIALGVMLAVLQSGGKHLKPFPAMVAIVSLAMLGVVAAVIGRFGVGRFIDHLVTLDNDETFTMCVLAVCLLASVCTEHLGFSTEIGAFIAGVMVSSHTVHTRKILESLAPVRDIFAALFFTCIGVHVDVIFVAYNASLILSLLAGAFCLKLSVGAVCIKLCGYPIHLAFEVGIGLAQIGEFAFILAANAKVSGTLNDRVHQLLVHTTVIGLLLTPLIMKLTPTLMARCFSPPSVAEATLAREQKDSNCTELHSL